MKTIKELEQEINGDMIYDEKVHTQLQSLKKVVGLIDEIDLKEYKDGEWYKGYNKALKEFKEELKKRING